MAFELKRVMWIASDGDEPSKRSGSWPSRALRGYAEWLVATPDVQPPDIQHRLLLHSMTKTRMLVASVFVTALTASVIAALTAEPWAYAWISASVFIGCIRIWVVHAYVKAEASGRSQNIVAPILAALAYFSVNAAGCYQCVTSGEWPLISIAGFGLASLIGAVAAMNAGTPRLALTLVCILMVPFSLACLISPLPHLFILGVQLPLLAFAVTFGMIQNYKILLHLYHSERENRRLAQHDLLTGLPNRALNLKRFDQLLAGLRAPHARIRQEFTVFCLDLDGFKDVNDSFGHAAGDAILVAVARRLRDCVRTLDFVSRIGGDEFVILLPAISRAEAARIADRIIAGVAAPFDIGLPAPVHIGVSVGSACAPSDGETTDELLRSADRALYEAKRLGRGIFVTYGALAAAAELVPAAGADAGMPAVDRRKTGTRHFPLPLHSKSL